MSKRGYPLVISSNGWTIYKAWIFAVQPFPTSARNRFGRAYRWSPPWSISTGLNRFLPVAWPEKNAAWFTRIQKSDQFPSVSNETSKRFKILTHLRRVSSLQPGDSTVSWASHHGKAAVGQFGVQFPGYALSASLENPNSRKKSPPVSGCKATSENQV